MLTKVAKLSDLPPGTMKTASLAGEEVALVNLDGEVLALDGICPHAYCSVAAGDLHGETLTCLCHGSEFDVRTGAVLTPPAKEPLRTYRVIVEGDDILIEA